MSRADNTDRDALLEMHFQRILVSANEMKTMGEEKKIMLAQAYTQHLQDQGVDEKIIPMFVQRLTNETIALNMIPVARMLAVVPQIRELFLQQIQQGYARAAASMAQNIFQNPDVLRRRRAPNQTSSAAGGSHAAPNLFRQAQANSPVEQQKQSCCEWLMSFF